MTTIVKLRVSLTSPRSGTANPGEMITVADDMAAHLIKSGAAVPVGRHRAEPVKWATKPVADAPALRGFAKMKWYRDQIKARGGDPKGNTLAGLEDQYRALGAIH